MTIYGTALLSICLLVGVSVGKVLGKLAGVDADIGGVGIAMLLLIFSTDWLRRTGRLKPPTELGVSFWGSIYIPIVVAMAASQNVLAALKAGAVAVVAGIAVVVVSFGLVGALARCGQPAVSADQESEWHCQAVTRETAAWSAKDSQGADGLQPCVQQHGMALMSDGLSRSTDFQCRRIIRDFVLASSPGQKCQSG